MIKIKSLHLKNFRSWSELNLVDIDRLGSILIVGANGAGKSSIRQAIEYLLLDKTSDDLKLSELPKDAGKNCMIYGEFEKDGVPFSITKYRNSDEFGNSTIFEIDSDKSLTATDRRVTQKNIYSFLGIENENTIYSSTIFSLNSPSFPELKESERKPILFDILPLSKYIDYLNKAKAKVEEIKGSMNSLERDKSYYEEALLDENKKLKNNREEILRYKELRQEQLELTEKKLSAIEFEDTTEIERNLNTTKEELEKIKSDFNEDDFSLLQKTLDKKEKEWYSINQEVEKLERERIKKLEQIKLYVSVKKENEFLGEEIKKSELDREVEKLNKDFDSKKLNNLTVELDRCNKNISGTEYEIETLNKELINLSDSECPILGIFCQDLKDNRKETRDKINSKLKTLKTSKTNFEEEREKLEGEYNSLILLSNKITTLSKEANNLYNIIRAKTKKIEESNSVISKAVKEVGSYKVRLKDLNNRGEVLTAEIESTKDSLKKLEVTASRVRELENSVSQIKVEYKHKLTLNATNNERKEEYRNQIKQIESEENPYEKIERAIKDQIVELESEIKRVEKEFNENQNLLPYYEFWVKGFSKSGIPNMLCEEFLSSLEYETNLILSQINNELTVSINSQSERSNKAISETISYEVHSPYKKIADFHSYSSGQQQRVKIADIFAFHKLKGFDFLILDELLELSLDEEGVESGIKLIQEKANEVSTMFVISHNDKIKDSFEKVFYIDYENGNSYLRS
jgi:DNA repair exonuclease SbcCD ATPase subunit